MNLRKPAAALLVAPLVLGIYGIAQAQQSPATTTPAPVKVKRGQHRERHPEIRRAMAALQRAKTDLSKADRDFGGHRAKAAELVEQALAECRAALAADKH